MIVFDTDVVTLMHVENPQIARRLETIRDEELRVTIVTVIEIMRGRYDFLMKASTKTQFLHAQQLLQDSARTLSQLPTLFLDEAALDRFELLKNQKGLKKIGRADLLIASIALARRATLVTRNLRHFQLIPHLNCENWVD